MKFIDKNGKIHNTYIGALVAPIRSKMDNIMNMKIPGIRESENVEEEFSIERNGVYNNIEDMSIPTPEKEELFVPGTTPRVQCSKKNIIKIDYDNHRMILEDEDGSIIHTTNIDSRLMNCSTKDLINMVYDIIPEKEKEIDESENKG